MPSRSLKRSPANLTIPEELFHLWTSQNSWLGSVLVDPSSSLILQGNDIAIHQWLPAHSSDSKEVSAQQLSGQKFEQFLHSDESTPALLKKPLEMADGSYFECLFQRNDGTVYPAQVLIKRIQHQGKDLVMVLFSDISAQKRMQRDLEAKQEGLVETLEDLKKSHAEQQALSQKVLESQSTLILNSKMAALGEMAGGVAHEINNPLAIIKASASILRDHLNKAPTPDLEKLGTGLARIEETVTRIAKIVSGLRSFSRNAAQDPMDLIVVSQVIEDSFSLCSEKFKNQSIRLTFDPGSFGQMRVLGRAAQLSQVLINLLGNSRDAIESLPNKWIDVKLNADETFISISVTDCGNGIPENVLQKIMQPFFTTKEVGKGTGLGLSISKGIIEDHKGSLTYDSSCPNTCFVIRLPLFKSTATKTPG